MFGKQLLSFIMALYIFSSEFQSALAGSTNMFNNFNLITLSFYCHWLSSLAVKSETETSSKPLVQNNTQASPQSNPNKVKIPISPNESQPNPPRPNLIQLLVSLKDSISPKGIWFTIVPFTCPQNNQV